MFLTCTARAHARSLPWLAPCCVYRINRSMKVGTIDASTTSPCHKYRMRNFNPCSGIFNFINRFSHCAACRFWQRHVLIKINTFEVLFQWKHHSSSHISSLWRRESFDLRSRLSLIAPPWRDKSIASVIMSRGLRGFFSFLIDLDIMLILSCPDWALHYPVGRARTSYPA